MRVLQLIDSLHAGGAERVAVNFANGLSTRIEKSYLCATRAEGELKEALSKEVHYLFLNRKFTIDFKAIKRLNHFIRLQNIEIIHAHATSYFIATLVKILNPKIALIWHDHYGESEFLKARPKFVLKWCSKLFNHVFTVNSKLENWSKAVLDMKSVSYLPNFAMLNTNTAAITKLKGENNKRIICLANLRPQKDHMTLLKAFKQVNIEFLDWTLHLVGKHDNDDYYKTIISFIREHGLENNVFIYGSCYDISNVLSQGSIGVLSSKSEGLPMALLEYGLSKLPVITTNVGDCNKVISNEKEGFLVESENPTDLANGIRKFIKDKVLREKVSENLHSKVLLSFSESASMTSLIKIYKKY